MCYQDEYMLMGAFQQEPLYEPVGIDYACALEKHATSQDDPAMHTT